jgi:diguanylate cyclase (GGDEF)-like protein
VAVALAALTIATVVVRTSMTFRELRHLTESRRLALTDELTGLGNRRLFHTRLHASVAEARRQHESLAVLMMDLDSFKDLNDTLGHQSGDAVLEQVGARLEELVGPDCTVARLGGDEFGIVTPVGAGQAEAEALASRILDGLSERFHAHDLMLRLTASIGIAMFPAQAADDEELLQRVDVALYEAKERPGTYAFYSPGRDSTSRERLYLAQELRAAIERDQLEVHYQPQVQLDSGDLHAAEALVRWRHPERGLIMPGEFLPLAERTDLSRAITRTVIEQVAGQLERWRARELYFPVSINLSAADLLDDGFVAEISETLGNRGLTPADVVLEVTEGIVMADGTLGHQTLNRLHDAGFELALDDFGTGHSSLSRLHDLPLSELKIDRSFVARLRREPDARSIVRSIVDLGSNLQLRLVAEGPEDAETVALLRELGCGIGQGYHFAKPLSGEHFEQWLSQRTPALLVA